MSNLEVKKVDGEDKKQLSFLEEMEKHFDDVKRRAFELFEKRGAIPGHDLDDWLQAEREILGWSAAELTDKDGNYEIDLTLPGFDPKDIEISVTPDELIIHANVEQKKESKQGDVEMSEFGSNDVYRRFRMPKPIRVDEVAATIDKGILHVKAPHAESPKAMAASVK